MSYNKVEKNIFHKMLCLKHCKKNKYITFTFHEAKTLKLAVEKVFLNFYEAHLIFLGEYNVFFSVTFPVFPRFQFSKVTFFRDSSFSF